MKNKSAFFVKFILSEENFSNICVLFQGVGYLINFQNTDTFKYRKILLSTLHYTDIVISMDTVRITNLIKIYGGNPMSDNAQI